MLKRILSLFSLFFIFWFLSPDVVKAQCTCRADTVNNINILVRDNCGSDTVATMYFDTDATDGCRCVCNRTNNPYTNRWQESALCPDEVSVNTALGCIPVEMNRFIAWLLPPLFGIAGAIAFLLMVFGFISMATSKGDPKAIQGGRETVTSAIIGLIVCIFAIFILRLIAIDILKIPGIS